MKRLITASIMAVVLAGLNSCGGSPSDPGTDPSADDVTVAEVALDRSAPAQLVPGQTIQLAAVAMNASGDPIDDVLFTWDSGDDGVAMVDGNGLVTGVGAGATMVTVESEGRSASLDVTVEEGGVVGDGDTEIVSADGAVRIFVPAGAAEPGTVLTIEGDAETPALPGTHGATGAIPYQLGPEGQTFSAPVTVTLPYDDGDLPSWVDANGLALLRWDGVEWHTLTDVEVDTDARTVSATTTGFSGFELAFPLPTVSVSPSPGQVNDLQRSVTLMADLNGPAVNTLADFSALGFEWTTPGVNGTLIQADGNQATYTATIPIVPDGTIDQVTVSVTGTAWDGVSTMPIGSESVDIDGDLQLVFQLLPFSPEIDFDQSQTFEATISPPVSARLEYEWTFTENHGEFQGVESGERTTTPMITYMARSAEESVPAPPRVDQLDVTVYQIRSEGPPGMEVDVPHEIGTAQTFVRIAGETVLGSWGTEIEPPCASAYIYVPKVAGATEYHIHAYGYVDFTGYWGTELFRTWGASGGGSVIDDGDQWKFPLSGGCGAHPEDFIPWLESRFAGMIVDVVVI
jgi:hypothetical protein